MASPLIKPLNTSLGRRKWRYRRYWWVWRRFVHLKYLSVETDSPGEVYGWMTGIESVQKGLKGLSRICPYPEDVIDVTLPEGGLEGLTRKETW